MNKSLFLHPAPSRVTPLAAWFGPEVGRDVILLAPQPMVVDYLEWAAEAHGFDPYEGCPAVEALALRLARQHDVKRIVALAEYDLVRAAHLRRILGLPGQDVKSAVAFRDKMAMKALVRSAGIDVAEHITIATTFDLLEFVDRVGYPVVLKPRSGGGSYRTSIVRDDSELEGLLLRERDLDGFLVESFVPGDMFHIDGLVHRGSLAVASVSRYVHGCLAFQSGTSLLSVQIDRSHRLYGRLMAITAKVLETMPTPETTAFHLEVFCTPDDRLVFCEIASRVGGSRINDTVARSHGVDLARTWIGLQLGLRDRVAPPASAPRPHGFAVIPPRAGRITSFPRTLEVPGIVDFHVSCKEGDMLPSAATSVMAIATMIVEADDEEELVRRLKAAVETFERSCCYGVIEAAA